VDGGATNATATMGATDANGNKCPKMEVCDLCLGAWCAGDSNMKWQWQGVLGGAHNLLDREAEQHKMGQNECIKGVIYTSR